MDPKDDRDKALDEAEVIARAIFERTCDMWHDPTHHNGSDTFCALLRSFTEIYLCKQRNAFDERMIREDKRQHEQPRPRDITDSVFGSIIRGLTGGFPCPDRDTTPSHDAADSGEDVPPKS